MSASNKVVSFLKPTVFNALLALALVFCLVPALRLSQPECHAYQSTTHGDGAPAPAKCLDGVRTPLSYALYKTHMTSEYQIYGGFGWGEDVQLRYGTIVIWLVLLYPLACGAEWWFANRDRKQNSKPAN